MKAKKTVNEAISYRCYMILKNAASRGLPATIPTLGFTSAESKAACALLKKERPDVGVYFSFKRRAVVLMPPRI